MSPPAPNPGWTFIQSGSGGITFTIGPSGPTFITGVEDLWPMIGPRELQKDIVAEPVRGVRAWGTGLSGVLRSVTWPYVWSGDGEARCAEGSSTLMAGYSLRRRAYDRLVAHNPGLAAETEPPVMPPVEHEVPFVDCGCGFWAFKEEDALARQRGILYTWAYHKSNAFLVTGGVLLWGRVIEHTDGYRAQFARPDGELVVHSPSVVTPPLSDYISQEITRVYPGTTVRFQQLGGEQE